MARVPPSPKRSNHRPGSRRSAARRPGALGAPLPRRQGRSSARLLPRRPCPACRAARRIHGVIDRHSGEVYNPDKRRAGRSDFSLRPVVSSFLV